MSITRAAVRAACMSLLDGYKDSVGPAIKLQTYPGRPRTLMPPTAFVDNIREEISYSAQVMQRTPTAEIVLVHGIFDTQDAVDQADAFTDGFLEYVRDRIHEAGANSTVGVTSATDDPTFINDWAPPQEQRTYFATRITLEGFGTS